MIKWVAGIFLAVFIVSCNTGSDSEGGVVETGKADTSYTYFAKPDSTYEVVNVEGYYVWKVDAVKKTIRRNPALRLHVADIDSIIHGLNQQYPEIQLSKIAIQHDTLVLFIKDALYFTNQMGSSGPAQYLAQAVINLTSVPGIKYVHIDLKEGEHAGPGTWSRKDFPGYIIIR